MLQAQRRFRERQKTKFIDLNTRVEELEGVIGELLSEKTRLEDRTSFLEKALECRSSSSESNLSAMPCSGSQAGSLTPASRPLACQQQCFLIARHPTLCQQAQPCIAVHGQSAHAWCLWGDLTLCCVIQDVPELQKAAQLGTQLPASASGGALALPAGINPEDIAEGSIRFFHDDLCLSIPFKGEHFMSIDAIKALTPRELILLYEASPSTLVLLLISGMQCLCFAPPQIPERSAALFVIEQVVYGQCCGPSLVI